MFIPHTPRSPTHCAEHRLASPAPFSPGSGSSPSRCRKSTSRSGPPVSTVVPSANRRWIPPSGRRRKIASCAGDCRPLSGSMRRRTVCRSSRDRCERYSHAPSTVYSTGVGEARDSTAGEEAGAVERPLPLPFPLVFGARGEEVAAGASGAASAMGGAASAQGVGGFSSGSLAVVLAQETGGSGDLVRLTLRV